MAIKFSEAPIGAKFSSKMNSDTVYMKIKMVYELKFYPRNTVVIEGPDKGGVGFFTDEYPIELIS